MGLECTYCQATIDDSAVDQARQIATCGSCGRIIDLQARPAESPRPRMRSSVELPAGMEMRRWWKGQRADNDGDGLELTRRWLRSKHFVMLGVAILIAVGLGYGWSNAFEPQGLLIAGTIIVGVFIIRLLPMFVNTTRIRVSADEIDVTHGPIPTLMFRNQNVSTSNLKQLFATKFGALYEVNAELGDGSKVTLVRPLVSEEQALYVEQALEQRLGIVDYEVDGELESVGKPAAVSSGAGGAMVIVPIALVFGAFMMFSAFSASLEGSFKMSGELGNMTFTPTGCESGQLHGFAGAQMTAKDAPGTVVRAIKDPVRGTLIAVEHPGQQPIVLSPDKCELLNVSVRNNGNIVNDVYAVMGSASAKCEGFEGVVKFDGCH